MDRIIKKKKWTIKKIVSIAGAGLFAIFIIYLFLFRDTSSRLFVDQDKMTIATVEQGRFQEFIPVDGVVQPIVTIHVDAVFGGRVEEIYKRDGAHVEEGDKILRLSNAQIEMSYMQQENTALEVLDRYQNTRLNLERNLFSLERQLADLEYRLDVAKKDYERKKHFYDSGVIPDQEYENAYREYFFAKRNYEIGLRTMRHDSLYVSAQMDQINESIDRVQQNIRMLHQTLDNLVIRAPISGQLSAFNTERGETKSTGQNLGQIDVLDGFKLRARIDERYVNRTYLGQPASFEYGGQTYHLEINKIYSNITGGAFEVDLHFAGNEPSGIRRGQTLQLRLQFSGVADALIIPRGGFYQTTGGNWIYVLDQSGSQAIRRPIRIGRQNIHHYEVLEGLRPGDRVITSSYDTYGGRERLVFR
ncbi:MAG: HlyD family efflux transporter periplasmic adaptor subunit [Bacteroidia bacterium]|nr:MAG: HlyD family efflux transporter periplasmic adaptor subunit [Bacteroidia bacterium]